MMLKKPFYGILLILLIALLGAIAGAQAQEQPGSSFVAPVIYEVVLINDGPAEAQWSTLEARVPPGSAYVGLAAGSQVSQEARRSGDRLVWEGPFTLPPGSELTLRYWLAPTSPELQLPTMNIVARTPTEDVFQVPAGPGEVFSSPAVAVDVDGATGVQDVTVTKVAETPELKPDDEPWIAYVVTFDNGDTTPAVLDSITDTLAPGFRFVGMAVGSDVVHQPADPTEPVVVWEGPFEVPGSGTLTLRYWVKARKELGTYVNSVEASGDGIVVGPATATVTSSNYMAYLPSVIRNHPPPPPPPSVLLDEDFLTGVPPEWNPVRLPEYWHWSGDGVNYGRYDFEPDQRYEEWALSLYLGENAQTWTDYRIETTFRAGWHFIRPLVGIWLRGTREAATGDLGGYVFVLRPRENLLHLGYVDPTAPGLDIKFPNGVSYANELAVWYKVDIEVRANNIQVWIEGTKVFDWTDTSNMWPRGTVGFAVFRGEGQFDDILVTPLE